jgi:hypothetical protein
MSGGVSDSPALPPTIPLIPDIDFMSANSFFNFETQN